ncbi:hypothetical protein M409DRAFT_27115 [Zasmidium cellare ATCC 36951]|uniref:Uncharacterized protein n=1 Tax=Zasmidium cellare ATCC 36951 TaxID=1080233 RepID=A0A6A6C9C9_ZASCE|nr:uncharacterized protein M409DRAFT_27115 [Zasmidium cellare ATCC 36951]KAF2162492.1 hypothetical protein M409DRAFT_27115 [Zasmidium cellare ATCC 36951]
MTVSSQRSPFLALPSEIRNEIYAYAFEDGELEIDQQYRDRTTPAPGLVFACRQTYEEGLSMYYNALSIVSKDPWILKMWLSYLNYLPDGHQFKLIKRAYLDCRNRSEQMLPLQLGQRFALNHHTQLSLDSVNGELAKIRQVRGPSLEVKVCIATPSQQLIWTDEPFKLGEAMEDRWNALGVDQKRQLWLEGWSPSGLNGLSWSRR